MFYLTNACVLNHHNEQLCKPLPDWSIQIQIADSKLCKPINDLDTKLVDKPEVESDSAMTVLLNKDDYLPTFNDDCGVWWVFSVDINMF